MDDLISRSAVINLLRELRIDDVTVNDKGLVKHIEELPTAYNVDKVVEELEKKMNHSFNQRYKAFAEAVVIVRKGGVEHG